MEKALIVATVSGFVPQFEMNNVKILQGLGYEVHYASNFKNPHYGRDNRRLEGTGIVCHQVDFVRSPFHVIRSIRAYRQLSRLMGEVPFALVHCHTPVGGVLGRLAAEKVRRENGKRGSQGGMPAGGSMHAAPARVIYTAHGFHFYKGAPLMNWLLYYPAERMLARVTDTLITINEEDYRRAGKFRFRAFGEAGRQLWKVNGVGVEAPPFYRGKIKREQVRARLGVQPGQLLLVSVGELNRNKNHSLVLRAMAQTPGRVSYLICGEGPERERLEALTRECGLCGRVALAGYQEDIWELLYAADAFLLPSLREGLPLSLQEAMACGLPAIVSDIRGNRDLIDHGKGGWLFRPEDEKRLHRILGALGEGRIKKGHLERMGEYNRRKVSAYSKEAVSKTMGQVYAQERKGDRHAAGH